MSFLTPLYIAALAAVSLPVLLHLIRRTPRGRVPFSTLMFLDPSPPRLTRRSRLDNWPLLLLRALALTLLALAFARPFWRSAAGTRVDADNGRRLVILLDTSASMRRDPLWTAAVARAQRLVEESAPADRIGLFAFDRQLTPIVDFDEWQALQPAARRKLVRRRLSEIKPGWAATHLGDALVRAAEMLVAADVHRTGRQQPRPKEIVLISDLQAGSRTAPLAAVPWPADVKLTLERVTPAEATNAGLQLAGDHALADADEAALRVRVLNAANSTSGTFQLRWQADGPLDAAAAPIDVYVPADSSRIVRVPFDPKLPAPARLALTGDAHEFDNTVTVSRPATQNVHVLFIGSAAADDPAGLRYYIEHAFPDNRLRRVTIVDQPADAPALAAAASDVGLVIVTVPLTGQQLEPLRRHAEAGGTLLFVASSIGEEPAGVCRSFGRLIGRPQLTAQEADVAGYAMWGDIDFSHPLLAPFDDPRFSDFTSIHFWKYRRLDENQLAGCRILARFGNGDPAVVTTAIGGGTAALFTSGWHPADSQLARSTKFVPLMNGLLELHAGRADRRPHYTVGDAIPLAEHRRPAAAMPGIVQTPGRQVVQLTSGQRTFSDTVVPGLYRLGDRPDAPGFTVGLAADESRTAPLPLEKLESLGVRLKPVETPQSKAAAEQRQRQLKAAELEGQQKIWRWLILAAIAALLLETWLAGRATERRLEFNH